LTAGPAYFWGAIAALSVGAAWLLADWIVYSRDKGEVPRVLCTIAILLFGGWIDWVAFRPAPLDITTELRVENYMEGQKIHGIEWHSGYSEVRIHIANGTQENYNNLDAYFRTNKSIANAGIKQDFSSCTWAPESVPDVSLHTKDKNGNDIGTVVPDDSASSHAVPVIRVHCDKLVPGDQIDIVLAVVFPGDVAGGEKHGRPSWVTGTVKYEGLGQYRETPPIYKCFDAECKDGLPPTTKDGRYATIIHLPSPKQ
jgi:hypothetical protein